MGLEGYLEDLGIGDILQIISISKKSGILTLENRQWQGTVSFLDGQVVRATSSQFPETLGQLLRQENLVTEEQIAGALAKQKQLAEHQPLGALLTEHCSLSRAAVEAVVKQQIENIVFSFFRWQQGSFFFQIDAPQSFGSTAVNPFDFMLEKGISPQWLVVKGEKIAEMGSAALVEADLKQELEARVSRQDGKELTMLRGMLAELENPFLGGGIILLILRFASEIMNRAVVFDVRGKQLVGLGQFGLSGLSVSADEIVRKMRLTVEKKSAFAKVLEEQLAQKISLGDSLAEQTLGDVLGGVPDQVFLAPVISDGKVVALLYGDNFPERSIFPSTKTFEMFLTQAGVAMEQALQL